MGVLGRGKEAMAEAVSQGEQLIADGKKQAVQEVMDGLQDTLAEPKYEGDVETALIHHLGEGAFYDDGMTSRYTGLAERIKEEAAKDERHGVPVLMMYKEHPEEVGRRTVFLRVPPEGEVQFKSEVEREEGVKMHAFTKSTAAVTHKRLSIIASASTFWGDLLVPNSPVETEKDAVHEFTLSASHTADGGHGTGFPSDYAFRNYSINRLGGDIEDVSGEEPQILVGWEEIDAALVNRVAAGGNPSVEEAKRVNEFFRVIAGISGFEAKTPRTASVIRAAGELQAAAAEAA